MTIDEEGKQLRNEITKLRPDKRRRYGAALRARILAWVDRAGASGIDEVECSRRLGVKTWRFIMWRRRVDLIAERQQVEQAPPVEHAPLALVPVEVPALLSASGITLVAPSGYRIEGLALDQAAALLRELA
jgi:hypothetical protein